MSEKNPLYDVNGVPRDITRSERALLVLQSQQPDTWGGKLSRYKKEILCGAGGVMLVASVIGGLVVYNNKSEESSSNSGYEQVIDKIINKVSPKRTVDKPKGVMEFQPNIGDIPVGVSVCTVPWGVKDIQGHGTVLNKSYDYSYAGWGTVTMEVERTEKGFEIKTPEQVGSDTTIPWYGATEKDLVKVAKIVYAPDNKCTKKS